MTQKRLNGVVLAHVHQALIDKIDLSKVAHNFVQKKTIYLLQSLESRAAARLKPVNHMQAFFVLSFVCVFFFFFSFRCDGHVFAIFFSLVFLHLFACLNGSYRCVTHYF